jgi:hypothetical protein
MDQAERARFATLMSRGQLVLFTGAGFSRHVETRDGNEVPMPRELAELLWPIGFPDEPFEQGTPLAEIYEVAFRRNEGKVGDLLTRCLTVRPETLSDQYKTWLSMPWHRHWTLNLDDVDVCAQRRFGFERSLISLSASVDDLPAQRKGLQSIHLNGRVSDFPRVTFSDRQYGERTARADPWYVHLIADTVAHPVLFVGTSIDEPPLWHYLALRGEKGGVREYRPHSYLVTPNLGKSRQALLGEFNIEWIPMTQEDFAEEFLMPLSSQRMLGLAFLERTQRARPNELVALENLLEEAPESYAEYLLGREPVLADIVHGHSVERGFEGALLDEAASGDYNVVAITGTAGTGKSTTLLRLSYQLMTNGRNVGMLALGSDLPLWRIHELVKESDLDALAIDDIDQLGQIAPGFVVELIARSPDLLVLIASRSNRYESLEFSRMASTLSVHQVTVPNLEDEDIESLLTALDRGNRLGRLKGLTHNQRVGAFRDSAGRQLLVAMWEATTGWRFEDKIEQECTELDGAPRLIYAIVALATSLRQPLTRSEVLTAYGDHSNESLNALDLLHRQHLLIGKDADQVRVRHRVIADHAVNIFVKTGDTKAAVTGLLFSMASNVIPESPKRSRQWHLLIRLLNHDYLGRLLGDDPRSVRSCYEAVETLLSWHPHYWLQRGRFETERGDSSLAHNFLEQSYSMSPDDPMVITAWAAITIRRASEEPKRIDAVEKVSEAFALLDDVLRDRGTTDSLPYHVYGSQGLGWARHGVLSHDQRDRLYTKLARIVEQGRRNHPRSDDLKQLHDDIKKDHLMLATEKVMELPAEES